MILIIWEYKVKPECTRAFEELYGHHGEWVLLFNRFAGYLGTELLKKSDEENSYLSIDRWQSAELYQKFLATAKNEYQRIDKQGESLMEEEKKIGSFERE